MQPGFADRAVPRDRAGGSLNKLCSVKVSVSKTVPALSSQVISKHKATKTARPHLCVGLGRLWGPALSELSWHGCISAAPNLCQGSAHRGGHAGQQQRPLRAASPGETGFMAQMHSCPSFLQKKTPCESRS